MGNIKLIGTSHVAKQSLEEIKKEFSEFKPDIIAVELDRQRYFALQEENRKAPGISIIKHIGLTGYLFQLIGRFLQKKIGKMVGMSPGEEMLLGIRLAKNNELQIALIDQNVQLTLKNMSKKIPLSEKTKFVWDIISSPFKKQEKIKMDLSKIPSSEIIEKLMNQLKGRYPHTYKVLVGDRNKFMAKKLFVLAKQNPEKRILAIIGAGHKEGMIRDIKNLEQNNLITSK